jgi:transposase
LTSFPVTLAEVEPGRKQVLIVEDWAEIRRLRKSEGVSISEIARLIGCSRNTVKAALASDEPPRYERARSGSLADGYDRRIRELLTAFPRMPATVIAERIGWPYSIRTLSTRVAELRPIYLPPDPASRTSYLAGEIAQCDFWFPPIRLPVGFGQTRTPAQLPVLTMITGYARWASGLLLPTRRAEDLYAGWWRLIEQLGAVPRVLVWDGEAAVGRWRARQPELTAACQGFRGVLGTKVLICKPADPEAKGIIERLHDYLERSFLPGRSFDSPADFNIQLQAWLQLANRRRKRSLGCAPTDRIAADRRRCSPCRRCRQALGGSTRCGCPGTTMSGWTATTTRYILRRWAAECLSAPTLTGSGCGARAAWSPTMIECGRGTKPSPTRSM